MMLSATTTLMNSYPNEEGLKLLASPWSPPAWMKAPREYDEKNATHASNMTGSAQPVCLRDGVGKESAYAKSWALFFSKWLDACEYVKLIREIDRISHQLSRLVSHLISLLNQIKTMV